MSRKTDTKEEVRTVTSNDFITAYGLDTMSLKARKLLYVAISQCRKDDREFFEYEISVPEFADLMGIKPTNVYQESRKICLELTRTCISLEPTNKRGCEIYTLFSYCKIVDGQGRTFKLNPDMTSFFLNLKKSFTQPLLADFLKMRSQYSMEIWHLMQREMHSKKPGMRNTITFDLSLNELRKVTGTESKFKQVGQFKEKVLDKAIREIWDNCGVEISYQNIKIGRTVVGFRFTSKSIFYLGEKEIKA